MSDLNPKNGIGTLIGQLVEDGKNYAQAEVAYLKALAGERLREARTGIVFLVVALVLLHGALIALFVGSVLALATLIGPGWATVAVTGIAALMAGIFAKIGLAHFRKAKTGPDLPGEDIHE